MTSITMPSDSAGGIDESRNYASELPDVLLPEDPPSALIWPRALIFVSIFVFLYTLDRLSFLLADYWLLQSLDLSGVFWTNFRMGAQLYVAAFLLFGAAIAIPGIVHGIGREGRKFMIGAGGVVGSIAAYRGALYYQEFLLGGSGMTFGEVDAVFGNDIGFYNFLLPNIWIAWGFIFIASAVMLFCSAGCGYAALRKDHLPHPTMSRFSAIIGISSTKTTRIALLILGFTSAVGVWLRRYDLLIRDNTDSSIYVGAEYLDVEGLFSTVHYITVTALMTVGVTMALFLILGLLHRAATGQSSEEWPVQARKLWKVVVLLLAIDLVFEAVVVLRDVIRVRPNEPVIQLPYIARHVEATRKAYNLDGIEEIAFMPNQSGDPLPSADDLLATPTLKNAPLWPGYVAYLDNIVDPQHAARVLQTGGDPMIYGPSLELFRQQQKLRTYYNFLSVDNVRYEIDGEKKMFVSSVREVPLLEPVPWLTYWGQRYMLFTHGFGLAMAPVADKNYKGEPTFVSRDLPPVTDYPEIATANPRVYYGEGSATMAFSNVDRMKELDYPTEQDRAEIFLGKEIPSGIHIDSLLKRVVFGWLSGRFFEMVFSDLITDQTRVHYWRTPLERLNRVASFLYLDTNPYAVAADGKIVWIVNAMTTADRYPYAMIEEIGDKSDERSPFRHRGRWINYVEDSVKATIDADTGRLHFYKIADGPVISAWEKIYPGLFTPGDQMPESIRKQMTYPSQLMHTQFDDLYIYYHMNDPMYFFNMEDMWDDGDEVLGPISDTGRAITFSIEPYNFMAETGTVLPKSEASVQYAMGMIFTNEKALNLRAIPIVYQDAPDYGKRMVLQVPKGTFVTGPEQADSAIDQDPSISQNFSWWNRRGTEVIRGHTTLLLVGNEVLYVEPIFLRSQQNPVPQLKKVVVVFRGKPSMADTLEEAVRAAIDRAASSGEPEAPQPFKTNDQPPAGS